MRRDAGGSAAPVTVLVARGRARVSVSASAADWPKRIRDMQYVDHDDFAVAH